MRASEAWRLRRRTGWALALLLAARLTVAVLPFRLWRDRLGLGDRSPSPDDDERTREAIRLSRHVERAAAALPFEVRCLPRAMALSWMLRRQGIGHALVFAARPRARAPQLHAWVERRGLRVIGDEPGPWIETLRLPR